MYGEICNLLNLARPVVHKEIPLFRTAKCPNHLIKAYKGKGKKEMPFWRLSGRKVSIG